MARKSTGSVVQKSTRRGTSYGIRFRALGQRQYQHVGYSSEGCTPEDAEQELRYVLEQVRRGEWRPRTEHEPTREVPTFRVFSSEWLHDRQQDLRATTVDKYRWELTHHLLPVFAGKRVDAITVQDVDAYRRLKVDEGRLGPTSINMTITRLAQILDIAVEYGFIERNPARGRRRRLKQRKSARPWLDPTQVLVLLDAAGELDRARTRSLPIRQPLLATLAWAGLRVGEACSLRWRNVDLPGGTIYVEQAKTDAGVRSVDLQPELREALASWRAATPFLKPDDFVFPTHKGGRMNRQNVRQRVLLAAADVANERLEARDQPALPDALSPHALRRSFASWLIAEGEDVAYVMEQIGHEDSSMTMEVYARAVRNGRRSVRSRRREQALDRAPMGTSISGAHDDAGGSADEPLENAA